LHGMGCLAPPLKTNGASTMARSGMSRKQFNAPGPRAAVISLHSSPQDQPGVGDSGGMNVYVLEVAKKLTRQGIAVDVYTRCHGENHPQIQSLDGDSRLIQVQAGPCAPVAKRDLPSLLPHFLDGVVQFASASHGDADAHRHGPYDVVHSHYWLSGWVGARAKQIWGAPMVTSFHTLGRVKNGALGPEDRAEPEVRLRGEQRVVRHSDLILAPTPAEARHLVDLYEADPAQIRVIPPGVDRVLFAPRDRTEAKARLGLGLGLGRGRMVLFVGRLQPFKGPHVAIQALAVAVARNPAALGDVWLAVVGGPSGEADEVNRLRRLASSLGMAERVRFFPPQPHGRLADFYPAAEVVLVPSRSESFGLVALEAQACGRPVVGAATDGLRHAVVDGVSGYLVAGHDPADYAERLTAILSEPGLASRMGEAGAAHALRFTWDSTADGVGRAYRELLRRHRGAG
jgi:D-inositol-3-phosphate glycosyltransferase